MTDHDLKIGAIVDLDICGRGCTGGLERDRGACPADVGEETTPIPRCLPLGSDRG